MQTIHHSVIQETIMPHQIHRRTFIKTSVAASTFVCAAPVVFKQKAWGDSSPNERFVIAGVGLGGMGRADVNDHRRFGDIAALCDVDEVRSHEANNAVGGKADTYKDYRKILERADIDVVSIATVDHWHVKIAVEAMMAGKHVFCQKPLTFSLEEVQYVREACKKYNKQVFQVGTQQRDAKNLFLRAIRMVQNGVLGNIQNMVVGIPAAPNRGPFAIVEPPETLDWDFWQGQVEARPYRRERCHGTFRYWYEYAGGTFTDWGAHHVDIAQWAIGADKPGTGPVEIDGTNAKHPVEFKEGYPVVDDHFNSSHDFDVVCKFANGTTMHVTNKADNGIIFEGTKGRIFVNRERITGKPMEEEWDKDLPEDDYVKLFKDKPVEWHKANFYRCIREGGLPVSDVFSHVQAMNTCHLCVIAARFNRVIPWTPEKEVIVGDDQAQAFFGREKRKGFEFETL
jgi:predicted dehydrogenase